MWRNTSDGRKCLDIVEFDDLQIKSSSTEN